ncbi:MAG: S8 family serine peptidase, partial [Candidatus Brocadiia bacterium]
MNGARRSRCTAVRQTLLLALLPLLLLLSACGQGPAEEGGAVVFVLDSPVHEAFLEGRVLGLRSEDVTHGSLVARVLRSYCRAGLAPVPVEGADGTVARDAYLDGLRTVLEYMRREPARAVIVNISLSNPVANPAEEELIRRLTEAGTLVVAAAGNNDTDEPFYPAAYPDVIAVASATRRGKALHSNYGTHVDIAASGDISFIDYEFLPYERLQREMEARGTSFAAPRVAGTVAFLVNRSSMTPREAYEVIAGTARPIADRHYRNGWLGAGLLDVLRARSRVSPGYRFAHFILPMAVLALLAVASGYLCARHGLPGVFLSVLAWVIALPGALMAALQLGRWLEF